MNIKLISPRMTLRAMAPELPRSQIPYLLFNHGYRKIGKLTSKLARFGLMNAIGKLARRLSYGIQ
jgi:hypothetical protein